jgi:hypothetical protein
LQQIKIKILQNWTAEYKHKDISGLNWPIINKIKGDLISLQANGKWKTFLILEKLFVSYFSK